MKEPEKELVKELKNEQYNPIIQLNTTTKHIPTAKLPNVNKQKKNKKLAKRFME